MVAEVVIGIAEHDVESHSAIELPEVLPHFRAPVQNEIHYIQIAVTCGTAGSVVEPEQRHGGSEMYAFAVRRSVETLREQKVAIF